MNIIYIHTHDTGRYILPYGYSVPTPTLKELAEDGILFRQAHSAAPTCSPSRASLLTGMLPHNNEMTGLAHRGFELKDYEQHLAAFLKKSGYKTILSGVQHIASKAEEIGYDEIVTTSKEYDRYTCICTDGTIWDEENSRNAAEAILNEKEDKFFLSMGLYSTHRIFPEVDRDIDPGYVQVPGGIPDTRENREDWAAFLTSAKIGDRCIKTVIDALKARGIYEDSLIIYTTDHGIAFPNMKCTLLDSGTGVSLIVKMPGNTYKGRVLDSLISQLDIFPTICEILGVKEPEWLQGRSLLPALERGEEINEEVFAEINYHAAYEPMRMVRTKRYKYIRYFNREYGGIVLSNVDNSPHKTKLVEAGWREVNRRPEEQLFDLFLDPQEGRNLAEDPSHLETLEVMREKLRRNMEKTGDPLLEGRIEKPQGARVNTLDSLDTTGTYE